MRFEKPTDLLQSARSRILRSVFPKVFPRAIPILASSTALITVKSSNSSALFTDEDLLVIPEHP